MRLYPTNIRNDDCSGWSYSGGACHGGSGGGGCHGDGGY